MMMTMITAWEEEKEEEEEQEGEISIMREFASRHSEREGGRGRLPARLQVPQVPQVHGWVAAIRVPSDARVTAHCRQAGRQPGRRHCPHFPPSFLPSFLHM